MKVRFLMIGTILFLAPWLLAQQTTGPSCAELIGPQFAQMVIDKAFAERQITLLNQQLAAANAELAKLKPAPEAKPPTDTK